MKDDIPSNYISTQWNTFLNVLFHPQKLHISRYVFRDNLPSCSLHRFCDASESGYAAVVYLRCKLLPYICKIFKLKIRMKTSTACTSTIELAWIHSSPHKCGTFVSNRVVQIQAVPSRHWRHIPLQFRRFRLPGSLSQEPM